MDSTASSMGRTKNGKGRRRIEMKKVEETSKRFVTFSKRKLGLFRKAAELSLLCKSDIAVVVFSQHGKVYSSGFPDPDSVIRRYLSGGFPSSSSDPASVGLDCEGEPEVSSLRREYEEAMKVLEDEKKSLKAVTESPGLSDRSWWNRPVGEMGLEEAVEFKERVELLRHNLIAAAAEKKKGEATTKAPVVSLAPPTAEEEEGLYMSALNEELMMVETDYAAWDCDWDWDSWNDIMGCNNGSSSSASIVCNGGDLHGQSH